MLELWDNRVKISRELFPSTILVPIMHAHKEKCAGSKCAPEAQKFIPHGEVTYLSPILSEPLCVLEFLALRFSPAYNGSTIPRGDGSAVVIIPGLIEMDLHLFELHAWLRRIGYRPYYSGMGFAADCPDQLSQILDDTIDRAYAETGRRVHLIGHSLGGIFARSAAVRRPKRIASVITLGSPFRGLVLHSLVLALSNAVRGWIRTTRLDVPGECASSRCRCSFGRSLSQRWPRSVRQTAMYTKSDGLVDWRYCLSGKPNIDVEVVGTHLGLPFNASVFRHIAVRLAAPRGTRAKK
jgi:triacylglycerol lipase